MIQPWTHSHYQDPSRLFQGVLYRKPDLTWYFPHDQGMAHYSTQHQGSTLNCVISWCQSQVPGELASQTWSVLPATEWGPMAGDLLAALPPTPEAFSLSCSPMDVSGSRSAVSNSWRSHGLYSPWNSPAQNTGVASLSFLQGIFPTQGSNPGLPYCRQILYQLSHKGSPCG